MRKFILEGRGPLPSKIKSILTKLFNKKYLTRGKKELSRKLNPH